MAYGRSKDLAKKTQSHKVLRGIAFKIASDSKHDGYERGLASMVQNVFDKKSIGSGVAAQPNYQLANELHKQIIQKFERRSYYSFTDNIWGVGLPGMQLVSKYNRGIKCLSSEIDLFSKYAQVVPLNYKKGISIVYAFQK